MKSKFYIRYAIAKPKTLWWSNVRRWRIDNLFAIQRHYSRDNKKYIYRITILRFTIGVIF